MKETVISEVSLLIDDLNYKDFPKHIYENAYYRATRTIAKKYEIFQKIESFILDSSISSIEQDCLLDLEDYLEEIQVSINKRKLHKTSNQITEIDTYYIKRLEDSYYFNYYTVDKSLKDNIVIMYKTIPEKTTYENGEFYIPHLYEEELIRETALYLIKIGISKFNQEKLEKYSRIYQLLVGERRSEIDKRIPENKEWVVVKTWKPY